MKPFFYLGKLCLVVALGFSLFLITIVPVSAQQWESLNDQDPFTGNNPMD